MAEDKVRQTPIVQSLDRGLMILQAVALSKQPVSLGDVKDLLGINHSSACRLANTLRRRGFLACPAGSKEYILGSSIWRLSHRYDWGNILIRAADKQLRLLADRVDETAHLAIRGKVRSIYRSCGGQ
jgi:DNA-binding IclR family transcriptional regulator